MFQLVIAKWDTIANRIQQRQTLNQMTRMAILDPALKVTTALYQRGSRFHVLQEHTLIPRS